MAHSANPRRNGNPTRRIARREPMKNLITVMTATLLFAAPAFGLACDYPERPTLPDGGTASKEDMISAQTAVKGFLAAVDEYLVCIEQEEKDAIAALPEIDESDEEAVAGREAEKSGATICCRSASMPRTRRNSCLASSGISRFERTTRANPSRPRISFYQRYFPKFSGLAQSLGLFQSRGWLKRSGSYR